MLNSEYLTTLVVVVSKCDARLFSASARTCFQHQGFLSLQSVVQRLVEQVRDTHRNGRPTIFQVRTLETLKKLAYFMLHLIPVCCTKTATTACSMSHCSNALSMTTRRSVARTSAYLVHIKTHISLTSCLCSFCFLSSDSSCGNSHTTKKILFLARTNSQDWRATGRSSTCVDVEFRVFSA